MMGVNSEIHFHISEDHPTPIQIEQEEPLRFDPTLYNILCYEVHANYLRLVQRTSKGARCIFVQVSFSWSG
jgi:hypothetical protein